LICSNCNQRIDDALRKTTKCPIRCQSCHSHDLGWRGAAEGPWRAEPIANEGGDGPWVRGDFDGDYSGHSQGGFDSLGNFGNPEHRYLIDFHRAQLENVELVTAPPAYREEHERVAPVRLAIITDALVYRAEEDGNIKVYRADLVDARLHDWVKTVDASTRNELVKGRLQGMLYARLKPASDKRPRRPWARRSPSSGSTLADTSAISPPNYCNTCNLFFFAAAFLILYIACRLSTALLGVGILALQCWWRRHRISQGKNDWPDRTEVRYGVLLCVLAVILYFVAGYRDCMSASWWWLIALALLLLLTALFRRCWPWAIVSVIWVLMLMSFYCKNLTGTCEIPPAPAASAPGTTPSAQSNPFSSLQSGLDNFTDGLNQHLAVDQDAQAIQAPDNNRISIDQALADPDKYLGCDRQYVITFSESESFAPAKPEAGAATFGEIATFNINQHELLPSAYPHLQKLLELMKKRPDMRIILTGHADQSGSLEHNIELSDKRARVVADWLMEQGGFSADRFEIRAAGTRYPLVNDPRFYRYNRRVDITIKCEKKIHDDQ
jgi:outer membrane protein OmpA-like peptidoglycan-associated protein